MAVFGFKFTETEIECLIETNLRQKTFHKKQEANATTILPTPTTENILSLYP